MGVEDSGKQANCVVYFVEVETNPIGTDCPTPR